jgi:hypothetical protein
MANQDNQNEFEQDNEFEDIFGQVKDILEDPEVGAFLADFAKLVRRGQGIINRFIRPVVYTEDFHDMGTPCPCGCKD